MTKDYGEIICGAVDEIVRSRLASLQFNVTKTCTVVSIEYRNQGKYIVSDGSITLTALSNESYNINDNVLVLIPNGDYNNDKLILSKVNKDSELPYNYTSPLSMMISLTENILGNAKHGSEPKVEVGALVANDSDGLSDYNGSSVVLYDFQDNLHLLNGFTRIGLRADFKTLLDNFGVRSGTYGLFLEVYSRQGADGEEKDLVTVLPFSSAEMAGNQYNFESYFTQEKVFDISYISNINRICVVFYQGADFVDADNNKIPHTYQEFSANNENGFEEKLNPCNLFVNNMELFFGQGVEEFDTESLTVYTNDIPSYHYTRNNEKTLNLRWVHKEFDGTYTSLTGGTALDTSKYEVRWYRYNSNSVTVDKYAGEGWEKLETQPTDFFITFRPDLKRVKEKIKVIGIIRDGAVTTYSSNVLELINEEFVPDPTIFDVAHGLSVGCMDNTSGNYFLFDQNGYLINNGLGEGYLRSLAPLWEGKQIDYDTFINSTVDYVEWWFPVNDTMIVSGEGEDIREFNNIPYKVFTVTTNTANNWDKNDLVFDYSIKKYWSKNSANNTIQCVLSVNGVEYAALKELQFGRAGSNGTNLTMVLEFNDNQNALEIDAISDHELIVQARLYDSNGSRVDFTPQQAAESLKWSWLQQTPTEADEDAYMTFEPVLREVNGQGQVDAAVKLKLNANLEQIPQDNYFILQAEYKADLLATTLTAFLPIPIKCGAYSHIEGAREVVYNHQGVPSYYKDAYKIFSRINKEYFEHSGQWQCSSVESDPSFIPHLSALENDVTHVALIAPQFYIKDVDHSVCITCYLPEYNENNEVVLDEAGNPKLVCVWSQPILIMQSQYDFAMLNSWDEQLTINEKNGTILSTMLGAGKKVNNVFSGVLIGDVVAGTGNYGAEQHTGVYGLHEGVLSFGLRDNGTAFIGKHGKGQILFDGNTGTISSPTIKYEDNKPTTIEPGIFMDLDNAHILISGNTSNAEDDERNLFDIACDNKTLMHVSDQKYYLQSLNYEQKEGFKIDLANNKISAYHLHVDTPTMVINTHPDVGQQYFKVGTDTAFINLVRKSETENILSLKAQNFNLTAGDWSTGRLELNNDPNVGEYMFGVGTSTNYMRFNLSDGLTINTPALKLSKTEASFEGKITSIEGSIGGWTIKSGVLYSGSTYLYSANQSSSTSAGGGTSSAWRIKISDGFGVTSDGAVYAKSGKIGGWALSADSLKAGNTTLSSTGAITISKNGSSAKITMSADGVLTAKEAIIDGKICANGGTIGKINIDASGNITEITSANCKKIDAGVINTGTLTSCNIKIGSINSGGDVSGNGAQNNIPIFEVDDSTDTVTMATTRMNTYADGSDGNVSRRWYRGITTSFHFTRVAKFGKKYRVTGLVSGENQNCLYSEQWKVTFVNGLCVGITDKTETQGIYWFSDYGLPSGA